MKTNETVTFEDGTIFGVAATAQGTNLSVTNGKSVEKLRRFPRDVGFSGSRANLAARRWGGSSMPPGTVTARITTRCAGGFETKHK